MTTRSRFPLSLAILWLALSVRGAVGQSAALSKSSPYKPAANADEALARIEELGGIVRRLSTKSDDLEVDFQLSGDRLADEHLQYLLKLKKVAVLRLRNTPISDAGLVHVGKLAGLKRLHLEKTAVTDAGMKHLNGLKVLESLNVYGTQIGDVGLQQLEVLPKLKSLFVWQTKVTELAILRLQKAKPGLAIVPDPAQDRELANAALATAKANLLMAEAAYEAAQKDAKELPPKAAEFKIAMAETAKQAAEAKKKADEAKKRAEEADKRPTSLKAQADDAAKKSKIAPGDVALKKRADDKQSELAAAQLIAEQARSTFDDAQKTFQEKQARADSVRVQSLRAANGKKVIADAQTALESARLLEEYARQRLDAKFDAK